MPLSADTLAQQLWQTLNVINAQTGAPDPNPSPAIKAYAAGVVAMLQAAIVSHLPMMVTATDAPPAAPIAGAAAQMGMMVAVGSVITAQAAPALGDPIAAANMALENVAVGNYFMSSAQVNFPTGTIQGQSTATPLTPGALVLGSGQMGQVAGISGSALYGMVAAAIPTVQGPQQPSFYSALCTYVMGAAQVTYAPQTINGACTNSGQLVAAFGVGGTIS